MTCPHEKQPKAKSSGCLLPSLLKWSRHSASDPALLVWPPQSVNIVSLMFRRTFPRLLTLLWWNFCSKSKSCFPKHGTAKVFLKPCSEMTITSHLSAKNIADHYFKCTQTSWAVCNRPPGVQLWVRINSDYRWTTDLTLINLPNQSDQWPKPNCSISCWEVIPSSVC